MSPTGTCAIWVSGPKGSQQTTFKRETAYEQGWPIGYSQQEITPQIRATAGLVGVANETNVNLNGLTVRALIDTGATVSTVSQAFYEPHLTNLPLCQMSSILNIECADGYYLPYLGYIEVNISVDDFSDTPQPCLLLVVDNSNYNSKVPIILGTNVLSHFLTFCQDKHGERFLQEANLRTPWYLAFRCMLLQERQLVKKKFRLGVIKCASSQRIIISANTEVIIPGFIDSALPYHPTCAVLQATETSSVPTDLDISPSLVAYEYGSKQIIDVPISNITTRKVVIQPRAILCEIQTVTIEERHAEEENRADFANIIGTMEIEKKGLSEQQIEEGIQVISSFAYIFSTGDHDLGYTTYVKHGIDLTDNHPFKQRHRRIPPAMYVEVRDHLHQLLAIGVIRRSHSPWSSNVVLARKKDGRLRMCIDYRQLNQRTIKDSYSLPRIDEMFDTLRGAKYCSILDMKSGYHQVEIEEEHKERTAFYVGPLGFFEFNRMPFGLSNSPATYQRLMNERFEDLHLKACLIYIDDIIVFGDTYEEHLNRLTQVLQRVSYSGMKLAPNKCTFFKDRVKFLGHIVSADGIESDPSKMEKIRDWPTPSNPSEVRQFLGFAGYYRKFVKDFAKITKPLSILMPSPTQSKIATKKTVFNTVPFQLGPEQEQAFNHLKELLTSSPIL